MNEDRERFIKGLQIKKDETDIQNEPNSSEENNKRNIKNKPSKWKARISAGLILAMTATAGLTGCKEATVPNSSTGNKTNDSVGVEDVVKPEERTSNETLKYSIPKEETLKSSIEDVKEDFLNKYIKAYNEQYGTPYMQSQLEIVVTSLEADAAFILSDGTKVTPGSYPMSTKDFLKRIGEEINSTKVGKVIQVLLRTGEEDYQILGTYDGNGLDAMFSGNDLEKIKDKDYILPSFEKLEMDRNVAKRALELFQANGNEYEDSLRLRIERYYEAVKDADKGYEIDD